MSLKYFRILFRIRGEIRTESVDEIGSALCIIVNFNSLDSQQNLLHFTCIMYVSLPMDEFLLKGIVSRKIAMLLLVSLES
jgi:hypothetical protein